MFRTQSRTDRLKDAATSAASAVSEGADAARGTAADRAELARERAEQARERAAELRETAAERGAELRDQAYDLADAVNDRAHRFADAAAPKVESARSAFVEDVLPKVAEAVATLAAGAAAAKSTASDTAHRAPDALAVLKGDAAVKRSGGGRKFFLFAGLAALAAAAWSVFRKNQSKDDPWATPAYTPPSHGRASTLDDSVTDAATTARDKAAAAGAAVAGKASEVKDAVKEKAVEVKDAVKDKVAEAKDGGATDAPTPAAAEVTALQDEVTDAEGLDGTVGGTTAEGGEGGQTEFAPDAAPSVSATSEGADLSTPNLDEGRDQA